MEIVIRKRRDNGEMYLFDPTAQPVYAEHAYWFQASKGTMGEYVDDAPLFAMLDHVDNQLEIDAALEVLHAWEAGSKVQFLHDKNMYWLRRTTKRSTAGDAALAKAGISPIELAMTITTHL